MPSAHRHRLHIWEKKALAARLAAGASYDELMAEDKRLRRRTLERLKASTAVLETASGHDGRGRRLKTKNLKPSGRPPVFTFGLQLLHLLKQVCAAGKVLSVYRMTEYIRRAHPAWLTKYVADREAAGCKPRHLDALETVCRRFASRNGFTFRRATTSKFTSSELAKTKREFAARFWNTYGSVSSGMCRGGFTHCYKLL